jgi:hypothetical protein
LDRAQVGGREHGLQRATYRASAIDPNENVTTKRENRTISVKARLKRGISLSAADAEIGAIAKSLAEAHPGTNRAVGAAVRSELRMRLERNPVYGPLIASLFVLVMLVLVIACCNVANLMLGRGRAREMATRLAIAPTASALFGG